MAVGDVAWLSRWQSFNGAETNCRIAHILGILLMNSCNTDRFLATTVVYGLSTLKCMEFSWPYRVLRIETLTKSQSVLSRWKQASRYIFATQTDFKSMLRMCYVRYQKCIENPTHDCHHDSHATSQTSAIYTNITQTGRIRVYCRWFWVVLVGFVVGCRWFWLVPCFSNYVVHLPSILEKGLQVRQFGKENHKISICAERKDSLWSNHSHAYTYTNA